LLKRSAVERPLPVEQFAALSRIPGVRHFFTRRVSGIDVATGKVAVLERLERAHLEVRREFGVAQSPLITAEQIHRDKIAIIDFGVDANQSFAGCDGLITNQSAVALGIHVADCCAVYIVDPKTPAIGLVHSGKKGTELGVTAIAIAEMGMRFGSRPSDLIVQLSPCIRPPHYEVDFAGKIIQQCQSCGVEKIYDSGVCTACHPALYYSYRAEKGRTGRMLALISLL
jgi:copper oxidase (laccase) domain-containing protein